MSRFKEGARVQLHPGTDRWMTGDRFGKVVQVREGSTDCPPPIWEYKILLDRSRKKIWFKEEDLLEIKPCS